MPRPPKKPSLQVEVEDIVRRRVSTALATALDGLAIEVQTLVAKHVGNSLGISFDQYVADRIALAAPNPKPGTPPAPAKRGPGRPRKNPPAEAAPAVKRGPGRPKGSKNKVKAPVQGTTPALAASLLAHAQRLSAAPS